MDEDRGELSALHAFVSGRVQGVGFRWHARSAARALALAGFVRNLRDGRVEVWAEGSADALHELADWLSRGPSAARVSGVQRRPAEPRGYASFEVEPDA